MLSILLLGILGGYIGVKLPAIATEVWKWIRFAWKHRHETLILATLADQNLGDAWDKYHEKQYKLSRLLYREALISLADGKNEVAYTLAVRARNCMFWDRHLRDLTQELFMVVRQRTKVT